MAGVGRLGVVPTKEGVWFVPYAPPAMADGVIAGVVAAVLWAAFVWCGRRWVYWREYYRLRGDYDVTAKTGIEYADRIRISVRPGSNRLKVDFLGLPPQDWVHGEIAMSNSLRKNGRGHYEHLKNGRPLWGFWDIQIKDARTIFVHTTFASSFARHKASTQVERIERLVERLPSVEGFIWEKSDKP